MIKLANASKDTRVHLVGSRFLPTFSIFGNIGYANSTPVLRGKPSDYTNLYVSGRRIGEEYRYIIERKFAKKYPGNLLERPGLLLNPWELRSTETSVQQAQQGQVWDKEEAGAGRLNG